MNLREASPASDTLCTPQSTQVIARLADRYLAEGMRAEAERMIALLYCVFDDAEMEAEVSGEPVAAET